MVGRLSKAVGFASYTRGVQRAPKHVADWEDDGGLLLVLESAYRYADIRHVNCWSESTANRLRDYAVEGVVVRLEQVSELFGGSWAFLDELASCRYLEIQTPLLPTDSTCSLRGLQSHRSIERLVVLPPGSRRVSIDWDGIDFSRIESLLGLSVPCAEGILDTGIQACESLISLGLSAIPRSLANVDIGRLRQLKALGLQGQAETVVWPDEMQLQALSISDAPNLRLDWRRLAGSLRYLSIDGKVSFDLRELGALRELRTLTLSRLQTIPSLEFLRDMPRLKVAEYELPRTATGSELSHENRQILASINAASGYSDHFVVDEYRDEHVGWDFTGTPTAD